MFRLRAHSHPLFGLPSLAGTPLSEHTYLTLAFSPSHSPLPRWAERVGECAARNWPPRSFPSVDPGTWTLQRPTPERARSLSPPLNLSYASVRHVVTNFCTASSTVVCRLSGRGHTHQPLRASVLTECLSKRGQSHSAKQGPNNVNSARR